MQYQINIAMLITVVIGILLYLLPYILQAAFPGIYPNYDCPACSGDGIERCNNPDHGFIYSGEGGNQCGRLGCPCCGHDDYYRMRSWSSKHNKYIWNTCEECNGLGQVTKPKANLILDRWRIDEPLEDFKIYHA